MTDRLPGPIQAPGRTPAPGFEALEQALRRGDRPAVEVALKRIVQELRDVAGLSYLEVQQDLEAFFDGLHPAARGRLDRFRLGLAAGAAYCDGWVAAAPDPITGLPGRAYLRQRCAEAVAQARWMRVPPAAAWGVVVVRCPPADDLFTWLVARHRVGAVVRECFCAGETVAALSSSVLVALVAAGGREPWPERVAAALAAAGEPAHVGYEPLPDDGDVDHLLDRLG